MKPFKVNAAEGTSLIENGGSGRFYFRWGMHPYIVEGEQQGYEGFGCWFDGMPTFGDLVDAMIRARYTLSDELALHRQRDSKPEEFAEYNQFAEACKAEAKQMLGISSAPAESENQGEGE
jgi:hypothetical protein